jgi:hypothetical protein
VRHWIGIGPRQMQTMVVVVLSRKVKWLMCEQHQDFLYCNHLARRSFLKTVGSATAIGVFGGALVSEAAYADALTKAQRDKMSPSEIIEVMKRGNERFRTGVRQNRNYLNEQKASASGQYPAAALLSCIDSRAPAEVIMDLGLGDIFNCRVGWQRGQPRHSRQHGIRLQIGRRQSRPCDGAHGMWRNQRRN